VRAIDPTVKRSYLRCHSRSHQWRHEDGVIDPLEAEPGLRPPFGQDCRGERSFCISCGCEKVAWFTRSGQVENKYRYPDGYLHKKSGPDDAAPSKLEWRLELVTTLFSDDLRRAKPAKAS